MQDKLHCIKEILIREKRTAYWLANQTGMSYNSIYSYLNHKIEPSLPTLFRIAEALNIDVRDLIVSNKNTLRLS